MIFVDTGAWYAWQVIEDVDHVAAKSWFEHVPSRLVTTDYVVDELLTLLKARGHFGVAVSFGEQLFSGRACTIEYVQRRDILGA